MNVNVLCMKWGTLYGAHYVNKLFHSVRRNLKREFRFVCFADDFAGIDSQVDCQPLPQVIFSETEEDRRWLKLGVFRSNLAELSGACLFLDLDVVIVDSIDDLFDYEPGAFCISHDWWMPHKHLIARLTDRPKVGNTSVFRFEANSLAFVLKDFEDESDELMERFVLEQTYITYAVGDRIRWWPKRWVSSFRRQCRPAFPLNLIMPPKVPAGSRIVAFHGLPKLDQAAAGYASKYPHKICRPSSWVEKYWSADS